MCLRQSTSGNWSRRWLLGRQNHGSSSSPLYSVCSAGVLADALLLIGRTATVFAPKVDGAGALHLAMTAAPTHSFVLYSSMFALLGGAGTALSPIHAALALHLVLIPGTALTASVVNMCLCAGVLFHRASKLCGSKCMPRCVGIVSYRQWAPSEQCAMGRMGRGGNGQGGGKRLAAMDAGGGLGRIWPSDVGCFGCSAPSGSHAVTAVMPIQWNGCFGRAPRPRYSGFNHILCRWAHVHHAALAPARRWRPARLQPAGVTFSVVMALVAHRRRVDAGAPLVDSGIDSLGAVELRNQLRTASGQAAVTLGRSSRQGSLPRC